MSRLRRLLVVALVLPVVGCGGGGGRSDGADSPEVEPLPAGLQVWFDQSRLQRQTRTVFVRLVEERDRAVTVTRAEIASPRFETVVWTGEKTFTNEADLPVEMPRSTCGEGSDAEVRLTYRVGDGPERVAETTAPDRYGAIALFLDRDCAEETFAEAATLELGTPRVVGEGRASYVELPVTMTPTGERDDVAFGGFEDTVLFRGTAGSPAAGRFDPVPLGPDPGPIRVRLRLEPTRCDPHALAEDKVGTLIGVRTVAPGLGELASYFLPIGDERRAALRRFFATHCGL